MSEVKSLCGNHKTISSAAKQFAEKPAALAHFAFVGVNAEVLRLPSSGSLRMTPLGFWHQWRHG